MASPRRDDEAVEAGILRLQTQLISKGQRVAANVGVGV
jgi:hypothetical protein